MIRRPPRSTRTDTLSLHDALPIVPPNSPAMPVPSSHRFCLSAVQARSIRPSTLPSETDKRALVRAMVRSEEHTSELQSLMRNSYAVFCLTKKKHQQKHLRDSTLDELLQPISEDQPRTTHA